MRAYLTISVDDHDHPGITLDEDEVDGKVVRTASVHLSDTVTLIGAPEAIRSWADEISMRASLL
jgi:hypothetical protein